MHLVFLFSTFRSSVLKPDLKLKKEIVFQKKKFKKIYIRCYKNNIIIYGDETYLKPITIKIVNSQMVKKCAIVIKNK